MKKKTQRWFVGIILGLLGCVVGPVAASGEKPSNSQYIIEKDVINAGGQAGQSATYTHIGSLGQSSPLGRSTSALSVHYGGFWGGGVVAVEYKVYLPVVLRNYP